MILDDYGTELMVEFEYLFEYRYNKLADENW